MINDTSDNVNIVDKTFFFIRRSMQTIIKINNRYYDGIRVTIYDSV